VAFLYGGSAPALAEMLDQQRDASRVFARVVSMCKTGQMSFPSLGDSSAAYTMSQDGDVVDLLFMRRGDTLMMLMEIGVVLFGGVPSVSQFEHFARLAASKVH